MLINTSSREPVYLQIIRQMEQLIAAGVMRPGELLPSVRSLSLELSINPNTIQRAYSDLDGRGIIYTVPGRGSYVSENAPLLLSEARRERLGALENLIRELRQAGMAPEEILACVRRSLEPQ